jgi:hypothetical protein
LAKLHPKVGYCGFYFSSGFQFRDFFFNLGNCRENLRKFFSENVISRPLWACPEGRNIAQNFPVPKLKTRLSLTGFLKRHDPTKSRSPINLSSCYRETYYPTLTIKYWLSIEARSFSRFFFKEHNRMKENIGGSGE